MKRCRGFVWIFVMLLCGQAFAADKKLLVVTDEWEGYTNKDGSGMYYDLLNAGIGKDSYTAALMPWKRAQKEFADGKHDVLLGADTEAKGAFPVRPIDVNTFGVLYSKAAIPEWKSDDVMKDKRIVWVRGYNIEKFMPSLTKYEEVGNIEQGMKMVASGRADVFVDYVEDMEKLVPKLKVDMKKFAFAKSSIPGGYTYVCFRDSDAGRALAKKFDENLAKLDAEHKLKTIYEKYGYGSFYEQIRDFVSKKK
jgi:polar amino acid transport system substrate-binding protein